MNTDVRPGGPALCSYGLCMATVGLLPMFSYIDIYSFQSKAELKGLCVWIGSVKWKGEKLSFTYTLSFRDNAAPWGLKEIKAAHCTFWSKHGKMLKTGADERIFLPTSFVDGERDLAQVKLEIAIPKEAEAMSVELSRSGLVTKRISLPRRGNPENVGNRKSRK